MMQVSKLPSKHAHELSVTIQTNHQLACETSEGICISYVFTLVSKERIVTLPLYCLLGYSSKSTNYPNLFPLATKKYIIRGMQETIDAANCLLHFKQCIFFVLASLWWVYSRWGVKWWMYEYLKVNASHFVSLTEVNEWKRDNFPHSCKKYAFI